MSEKLSKLIAISDAAKDARNIEIWTDSFVAKGKLFKDKSKVQEEVVTLQDAIIMSAFVACKCDNDNCNCHGEAFKYEWLNIFEDKIVAFSISPD